MTRINYERRSGALRKLLRQLKLQTRGTIIEYCFGALYDTTTGLWHIYNFNTNNCIATVKFYKKTVTIRYRRNSHYSHVLKSFEYPARTLHVESEHLSQKSRWLRDMLRPMIMTNLRAIQRAERRNRPVMPRGIQTVVNEISETTTVPSTWRDVNGRLRYTSTGRYAPEVVSVLRPSVTDPAFFIDSTQYRDFNPSDYMTSRIEPINLDALAELEAARQESIREMESDVPF